MAKLDILLDYMKREPCFEVKDAKSEQEKSYLFTYDQENCSLFYIENRQRFNVTNCISVLFGIAQEKPYLEVNLHTAGKRPPLLVIELPQLIFS